MTILRSQSNTVHIAVVPEYQIVNLAVFQKIIHHFELYIQICLFSSTDKYNFTMLTLLNIRNM